MIGGKENFPHRAKADQKGLEDNGSIQKDSSKEVIIGIIDIKHNNYMLLKLFVRTFCFKHK
jgi:hypothetical protein